jgi:hypothetical protein
MVQHGFPMSHNGWAKLSREAPLRTMAGPGCSSSLARRFRILGILVFISHSLMKIDDKQCLKLCESMSVANKHNKHTKLEEFKLTKLYKFDKDRPMDEEPSFPVW